jgi:hypothetical protein
MRMLPVIVVLAMSSGSAVANPGDEGPRSPVTATLLAVGVTAAGYAGVALALAQESTQRPWNVVFAVSGMVALLGPSTGQLYGWDLRTTTLGFVLRIVSLPVGVVGLVLGARECYDDEPCPIPLRSKIGLGLAAGMLVGGTILDLAIAGRFARAYNRRYAIGPMLTQHEAGIAITARF